MKSVQATTNLKIQKLTDEYKGSWCARCQTYTLPAGSVYMRGTLKGSGSDPWMFICPPCMPEFIAELTAVQYMTDLPQ